MSLCARETSKEFTYLRQRKAADGAGFHMHQNINYEKQLRTAERATVGTLELDLSFGFASN